jgi:hypothetical protein
MAAPTLTRRTALLPAAALCAAMLSGCSILDTIAPAPTTVNGNSQLTANGIAAIKTTQAATFDFTSKPLKMAALGFPEDSEGAIVATGTGAPIAVSMKTTTGVVKMNADAFRVWPGEGGVVDRVDLSVRGQGIEGTIRELRRAGDDLGFNLAKGKEATDNAEVAEAGIQSWRPGYGNKAGTAFSVEIVTSAETGGSTFIYSAHLADDFYTAESAARIAETGKL